MVKKSNQRKISLLVAAFAVFVSGGMAYAAPQGQLSQSINAGTISTDIVDANGSPVAVPSFAMSAASISTVCQTVTGTYGSNSQRVSVDNPGGADNGWSLAIAPTTGPGATWTSGSNSYSVDDPADSGCTNGQMTLNPAAATLGLNGASTSTGIAQGSQAAFSGSPITLLTAASGSDNIWNGYLTGIAVSQKIPGQTPAGSYTVDLTQTVTAI